MRPDAGSGDPGLLFRAQSGGASNNGGSQYYLGLYPGSDEIVLGVMDDDWLPFASASVTIDEDTWYSVRVHSFGSSIEVYIDDVLHISTTDSTYAWGGVGFRSYYSPVTYDHVTVCN